MTTWIDEAERLARAVKPCTVSSYELAQHNECWSPDRALKVLAALRAAENAVRPVMMNCKMAPSIRYALQHLRDELAALEAK